MIEPLMISQRAFDSAVRPRTDGETLVATIEAIGRITEVSLGMERYANEMIVRAFECPEANPMNWEVAS